MDEGEPAQPTPPDSEPVIRPLLLGDGWYLNRPGGLNRYLAGLHRALKELGMDPRAVVIGPTDGAPAGFDSAASHNASMVVRLAAFYRRATRAAGGATLVDSHFAMFSYLPVRFGRLRRLPLVVHFQGPWAQESVVEGGTGLPVRAKRAAETWLYRRAGRLVTLSGAFRKILVESYGVPPWRISVIPPGVDLERFGPGEQSESRRLLDLPEDAAVVVVVRRLVPRMGLEVLVEAWSAVLRSVPDAVLLVVGEGPQRSLLQEAVRAQGSGPSVRFMGPVDDATLPHCYRAADLSVVPTTALEGFGLSVLESLACGVACVVSDVGGLPEAVAGLDDGLIVPAGEAPALAERLIALLSGTRKAPGPSECRNYAETFTWRRAGLAHAGIYREVLERLPPPPRVVFVDHCAQLSGGEIAMVGLLRALKGVQTHVILGEDGPLVGRLLQAGISVEVLPIDPRAGALRRQSVTPRIPVRALACSVLYSVRLARRIRRLRPDVVHANSLKAGFYGLAAARLARVPGVWHVRDRIAPDYLPAFAVRLVRRWTGVASAVIANSRATGDTLPPRCRPTVIPSPVRLAEGPPGERPPHPGPFRVGMVGRLQPWKGQDVFLKAFAEAFPDCDARAVIVGSPMFGEEDFQTRLGELAEGLAVADRVEMLGFRRDVAAELAALDVLVHASVTPEPFGAVVVEGMAAGLPVVAAAAGGPLEIVTDGVDGLLYPPGDVHALAARLRRLYEDRELAARLGQAGRVRSRDFAPEKVAESVLGVYRRTCGERWPAEVAE